MTFKFEVSDGFFPMTFKGEIESDSKEKAIQELCESYALELDTNPSEIQVTLTQIK